MQRKREFHVSFSSISSHTLLKKRGLTFVFLNFLISPFQVSTMWFIGFPLHFIKLHLFFKRWDDPYIYACSLVDFTYQKLVLEISDIVLLFLVDMICSHKSIGYSVGFGGEEVLFMDQPGLSFNKEKTFHLYRHEKEHPSGELGGNATAVLLARLRIRRHLKEEFPSILFFYFLIMTFVVPYSHVWTPTVLYSNVCPTEGKE